jgi:peptidoglycan/xylan/chitin deacetylase (PgdA/CDA1 family)
MAPKLLIVNYHYIREQASVRGIFNVTPEFFVSQLDAIYNNGFEFVALEDIHRAIRASSLLGLPHKACLITFDDGLLESYELGLSILDRKGIPGVFYLSSLTLDQRVVLDVHKLHYIQTVFSSDEILSLIPTQMRRQLATLDQNVVSAQYIWDDYKTGQLKYLFNFLLKVDVKKELIKQLFNRCVKNEADFAASLYMTKDQIFELSRRGYLGSHGREHLPLATLSKALLSEEVAGSKKAITEFCGRTVESIAYPYGGESAINENVIKEVALHGFVSGVTMIRGMNIGWDMLNNPLCLKRFDTNDVFGGKSEHLYKEYFNE